MIILQTSFWDVVSSLGSGGAGAVIAMCVILYFQSKTTVKSDTKRGCRAEEVQSAMQSSMNMQTELLRRIDNSSSDTRDGVNELVTIQRNRGGHGD